MTLLGVKNPVWMSLFGEIIPITTFDSLYESFQALTSIQVSHFVEWFSGSVFDSNTWILTQVVSSGTTAVIDDSIDGGVILNSDASSQGSLTFNTTRHYDPAEAIVIFSIRYSSTIYDTGYGFSADTAGIGGTDQAMFHNRSASSFILGQSGDGGTVSETATDVPPDLNSHTHKIELTSSNILYTMDGVLKLTKATNRPVSKQMPILEMSSANGAGKMHCFYLECYNTSISILSSLHERLSPLTQVLKQRVVETFSGALLNERWTTRGGGTFLMADSIDGGFEIFNPNSANSDSRIDFNNKRQYDFDNSVIIFVMKSDSDSNFTRAVGGFENTDISLIDASLAGLDTDVSATKFFLGTGDNSSSSNTVGSVDNDTSFHVYKIENSSADIKLTIDGVLDITKITNRPTLKFQPFAEGQSFNSTGARTLSLRYLEAYNKLTTETDFPSVYELFNPLTTISKQHFWDWFDGSILSNKWTTVNIAGTGTFAMDDTVDGGFTITSGGTNADRSAIGFNDISSFDQTNSEFIFVGNRVSGPFTKWGAKNAIDSTNNNLAVITDETGRTNKAIQSGDGSASSATEGSVPVSTALSSMKLVLSSTDIKSFIDGVLDVTKTTNRPASPLQPMIFVQNVSGITVGMVSYCEAKNV